MHFQRIVVLVMSVLSLSASPVSAETGCNEDQIKNDFDKVNLNVLEYLLLPTPYRALCGHAITDDVQFWEGMIARYNCTETSDLAQFLRHHWTKSVESRRSDFDAYRAQDSVAHAKFCEELGKINFPDAFSMNGLSEIAQQLSDRLALLPK